MKILSLIITYLILSQCLYSQGAVNTSKADLATNSGIRGQSFGTVRSVAYDDIEGSPYYHDEYLNSTVVKINGDFDSIQIKYDLVTHSFIGLSDAGEEIALRTDNIREFRINFEGEEVVFKRVDPKTPYRFYEIIYEGTDITIFKDEIVKIEREKGSGISKSRSRFYTKKNYLVKLGKEVDRVKLKKKNLWKHFNEEQREILNSYLKQHKTKLKNEKDYRSLFKILNDDTLHLK